MVNRGIACGNCRGPLEPRQQRSSKPRQCRAKSKWRRTVLNSCRYPFRLGRFAPGRDQPFGIEHKAIGLATNKGPVGKACGRRRSIEPWLAHFNARQVVGARCSDTSREFQPNFPGSFLVKFTVFLIFAVLDQPKRMSGSGLRASRL